MGTISEPRPREYVASKFRVGDKVRLISDDCMRASIGATAIVTGYEESTVQHGLYYVCIRWDRNELSSDQCDGGYNPDEFEVIVTTSLSEVLGRVACPRCGEKMEDKTTDQYGTIKKCSVCGFC